MRVEETLKLPEVARRPSRYFIKIVLRMRIYTLTVLRWAGAGEITAELMKGADWQFAPSAHRGGF